MRENQFAAISLLAVFWAKTYRGTFMRRDGWILRNRGPVRVRIRSLRIDGCMV